MSTTMDKTQRTLMMILPVAFVPVLVNFPVGLVLYWVTTNLWTVGPGSRHAPAGAEEASGATETLVEDAAEEPGRSDGAKAEDDAVPNSRLRRPHRSA